MDRVDLIDNNILVTSTQVVDNRCIHRYVISNFPVEGEWRIPGKGNVSRQSCGSVSHINRGIDCGNYTVRHRYCYSPDCPVCYTAWAMRSAELMGKKIYAFQQIRKVYHWVVSYPGHLPISEWKRLIKTNFRHGYAFFHPYRLKDKAGLGHSDKGFDFETAQWVTGNHFHVLTWTDQLPTKEIYEETGLVIHRIARVDDLPDASARLTAYELSHVNLTVSESGKSMPTVFSFGLWSNSKLRTVIYSYRVKNARAKCYCARCGDLAFHEMRSDLVTAKVIPVFERELALKTILCKSTFDIPDSEQFEIYTHAQQIYYPKYFTKAMLRAYLDKIGMARYPDKAERTVQLNLGGKPIEHISSIQGLLDSQMSFSTFLLKNRWFIRRYGPEKILKKNIPL